MGSVFKEIFADFSDIQPHGVCYAGHQPTIQSDLPVHALQLACRKLVVMLPNESFSLGSWRPYCAT